MLGYHAGLFRSLIWDKARFLGPGYFNSVFHAEEQPGNGCGGQSLPGLTQRHESTRYCNRNHVTCSRARP